MVLQITYAASQISHNNNSSFGLSLVLKFDKACNKSNDPVAKENMNLYNYLNSVVNK